MLQLTSAHAVVAQVVWSAWLSTLGHAPSVMDLADSQNVHNFTDSASSLVDQFVPVSLQVCLLPLSVVTAHSMYDDCWQSLSVISAAATVCCCCYCLLLLSAALLLPLLLPTFARHTTYSHCLLSLSAFVKRLSSTADVVGSICLKVGGSLALTCQNL